MPSHTIQLDEESRIFKSVDGETLRKANGSGSNAVCSGPLLPMALSKTVSSRHNDPAQTNGLKVGQAMGGE